jgi:hypothetical protein
MARSSGFARMMASLFVRTSDTSDRQMTSTGFLNAVPRVFALGTEAHQRAVVGGGDNCPVRVTVGAFDMPDWARWQGRRGLRLRHNRR